MIEKWERSPQRIGMVVGFVALPLLWWLQDYLLHLALGFRGPSRLEPIECFAAGAIPGVILGAGISKAAFAARQGHFRQAKWHLLIYSCGIVGWKAVTSSVDLWQHWPRPAPGTSLGIVTFYGIHFSWWAHSLFLHLVWKNIFYFPLHAAILMFFIGLLMRSRH